MTSAPTLGATRPVGPLASTLLATVPPEATLREVLVELATEEIGVVLGRSGPASPLAAGATSAPAETGP
jgi:hypothetical protein